MNRLLSVQALVVMVLAIVIACGGDDGGPDAAASPPATDTATPLRTSTPIPTSTAAVTSSATPMATLGGSPAAAAVALARLNGLRCTGQWRNTTHGTSGAFSVRIEAGGGGGLASFEIGGPVFGAEGGVFEAPFRLEGTEIVISSRSDFLGEVTARIQLDGSTGEARLAAPPALGEAATVTLSEYSLAANVLHFALTTDYGDGRAPASSVVDAACALAR
jgi:hypothetical protein